MIATGPHFSDPLSYLQSSEYLGVITATESKIITSNDTFLRIVGFTREELESGLLDWREITSPESRGRHEDALEELRERGACLPFEKEYILRDGTRVPVMVGAVRCSSEPFAWVAWVTDLRAQKQRQIAEARARELSAQMEAEMSGASLLTGIYSRLLGKSSVTELLNEILDAAIELTGASFGTFQLIEGDALRLVASRNLSAEFVQIFERVTHESNTSCGAVIRTGARVIVEDIETDPLFEGSRAKELHLQEGIRAVQSTPLLGASGEIYGVFSTHFSAPGRPDERTLRFVDLLAARASQILERLQYVEARRLAERLEASAQLANLLAHELNNPVQALVNVLALLCENSAVTEQAMPLVQAANEQLNRISTVLHKALCNKPNCSTDSPRPHKLIERMREEGTTFSAASSRAAV